MIGGCLTSSAFPYDIDLYSKVRSVDPNTGQIKDKWVFWKTIKCRVRAFKSTSYNAQGTNELFEDVYVKQNYLKLFTKEPLPRDIQVHNIRNADDQKVIFAEWELAGHPATWFNTNGSAPVIGPFGEVIEYDTMIERATEQGGL